jgi:hypothetical protein
MAKSELTKMRVVIFQDGDVWIAQCLEHDISAQGIDFQSAMRRLTATVAAESRHTQEGGGDEFAGIDPAPEFFHRMFEATENSLHADHMEFRVAA